MGINDGAMSDIPLLCLTLNSVDFELQGPSSAILIIALNVISHNIDRLFLTLIILFAVVFLVDIGSTYFKLPASTWCVFSRCMLLTRLIASHSRRPCTNVLLWPVV
jgi:hypothetical protein